MPGPSRTMSVAIPHRLGRAEARRRLDAGLAKLQSQFAAQLTGVERAWDGDRLTFAVGALGQRVTGTLDVRDDDVAIEVALPWLLAAIADRVRTRVEREAQKLLGPPGAGPAKP